jgi:hypothetical protein
MICGAMHTLASSTVDLEGPAFRAYYCPKDTPEGAEVDSRDAVAFMRHTGSYAYQRGI